MYETAVNKKVMRLFHRNFIIESVICDWIKKKNKSKLSNANFKKHVFFHSCTVLKYRIIIFSYYHYFTEIIFSTQRKIILCLKSDHIQTICSSETNL